MQVALLAGNECTNLLHLGGIYKSTLHTHRLVACQEQHVALAHKLVGTGTVEDGARVNHGTDLERHACREVGLDGACDDVGGGALRGDDHVDTHGTCQLCDACDGQFYLLAGRHDEVAELVDNDHDIGHELVAVLGVELAVLELLVIFLEVTRARFL